MSAKEILFGMWLTMTVVIVTYLLFVNLLWRRLRRNSPAICATLGSPSFFNNSPRNGFVFVRWLLRRDYLQTGDPTGIRMAKATEAMFWIGLALILFTFALGIATRGGEAWPL